MPVLERFGPRCDNHAMPRIAVELRRTARPFPCLALPYPILMTIAAPHVYYHVPAPTVLSPRFVMGLRAAVLSPPPMQGSTQRERAGSPQSLRSQSGIPAHTHELSPARCDAAHHRPAHFVGVSSCRAATPLLPIC